MYPRIWIDAKMDGVGHFGRATMLRQGIKILGIMP